MIVARGLGRRVTGATGIIAAAGLGLLVISDVVEPSPVIVGGAALRPQFEIRVSLDDRDLLELVPVVVEVLNGRR